MPRSLSLTAALQSELSALSASRPLHWCGHRALGVRAQPGLAAGSRHAVMRRHCARPAACSAVCAVTAPSRPSGRTSKASQWASGPGGGGARGRTRSGRLFRHGEACCRAHHQRGARGRSLSRDCPARAVLRRPAPASCGKPGRPARCRIFLAAQRQGHRERRLHQLVSRNRGRRDRGRPDDRCLGGRDCAAHLADPPGQPSSLADRNLRADAAPVGSAAAWCLAGRSAPAGGRARS
jgi:hypothetical protein